MRTFYLGAGGILAIAAIGVIASVGAAGVGNAATARPVPAKAAANVTGKAIYEHWCASCHAPGVAGHPGTLALAAKYKGEIPADLEQRKDLSPEVVRYFVRNGVSMMAPFRKTEISDAELDALARYLAHAQ